MTALRTTLAFIGPMPAYPVHAAVAGKVPALLKNMVLFLASPFIGLAYAVLLPFVGLGMLLWVATEGLRKPRRAAGETVAQEAVPAEAPAEPIAFAVAAEEAHAHGLAGVAMLVAKLLAAPLAGLAFVIALPFVALGALAWTGARAALARTTA